MTDAQTTPTTTAGSIEALRFRLSAVLAEIEAVPGEISQALAHAKDSIHRAVVAVEMHFAKNSVEVEVEVASESADLHADEEAAAVATAAAALGSAQ